jgi:hypothetical protein
MELKEYIGVVSLLISCASLSISAFNAYWGLLRGPKYIGPPLRWIAFGRLPESGILIINFPVTVTNIGSRTGVIDAFSMELLNARTNEKQTFYAWQDKNLLSDDFTGFKPDIPSPCVLKPGESLIRHYIFFPNSTDFMYTPDVHSVSLYVHTGYEKRMKLYEQEIEIKDVVEPISLPNQVSLIYSFNLFPKQRFIVSNYGTSPSKMPSIIQLPGSRAPIE